MTEWITIQELIKRSGVGYHRIRNLIKKGLPHKMVIYEYDKDRVIAYGKNFSQKRREKRKMKTKATLIDYNAWLEIPTFLRQYWAEQSAIGKRK